MSKFLTVFCGLLLFASSLYAQDNKVYIGENDTIRYSYTPLQTDSIPASQPSDTLAAAPKKKSFWRRLIDYFGESSTDKTFEKKIDFTFIGGPSYSKDTQFSLAVMAAGLYRLDRTDSLTPPSDITAFITGGTTGFYMVGINGNNIFSHNRHRISYKLSFYSQPTDYWGIGYSAGANNPKGSYVEKRYDVDVRYLYQVVPNMFIGASVNFRNSRGIKFTRPEYIEGQNPENTTTGIGAIVEYDTRDFIPNPYKGLYLSLKGTWRPDFLGSNAKSLWQAIFTANSYHRVWKGGIVATELYGEFNASGTPWLMKARLGGSKRMRGYYEGQYNDNDMITLQVELRHPVSGDHAVVHRLGLEPPAVIGDELLPAHGPQQPELPGQAVKLPDQLDAQGHHVGKRLVSVVDHVPGQLAPRLLQGGDGRGQRHHRLAQFGHLVIQPAQNTMQAVER